MLSSLKVIIAIVACAASVQVTTAASSYSATGTCVKAAYFGSPGENVPLSQNTIDKKSVITQVFKAQDFQTTTVTQPLLSGPIAKQEATFLSSHIDRYVTITFHGGTPQVVYILQANRTCTMMFENETVSSIHIINV